MRAADLPNLAGGRGCRSSLLNVCRASSCPRCASGRARWCRARIVTRRGKVCGADRHGGCRRWGDRAKGWRRGLCSTFTSITPLVPWQQNNTPSPESLRTMDPKMPLSDVHFAPFEPTRTMGLFPSTSAREPYSTCQSKRRRTRSLLTTEGRSMSRRRSPTPDSSAIRWQVLEHFDLRCCIVSDAGGT